MTRVAGCEARVLRPASLTPAERAAWTALAAANPATATGFLMPFYAEAAARVFPGVRVCVLSRAGEPVGFFAFQTRGVGARLVGLGERLAGGMSDYFGLVAAADLRLTPAELLRAAGLATLPFDHLDETQMAHGLAGTRPEAGLRIVMPPDGAAFWPALRQTGKRFAADTERRERKLVEAHGALRFVLRVADPAAELVDLIRAKRAQYERTSAGDSLADPRRRRFLDLLARGDDADCQGVLSTLHAGETWVARHFGLLCRGSLHYWFPVYNPAMHAFSPGRLLLKNILEAAPANGIARIDRGQGDTPAKRDFANEEHAFLSGVWMRPTVSGYVARGALSADWRLRALVRRLGARAVPPATPA